MILPFGIVGNSIESNDAVGGADRSARRWEVSGAAQLVLSTHIYTDAAVRLTRSPRTSLLPPFVLLLLSFFFL